MANTKSAKKAIKQSQKKRLHNLFWKAKIKEAMKTLAKSINGKETKEETLRKHFTLLQKALDKAAKEKVIHKNKANRLKSKYATKISTAHEDTKSTKSTKSKSPRTSKKSQSL